MSKSNSDAPLRVAHIPFFESNLYQVELSRRLDEHGIRVIPCGYSKKLPTDIDLLHINWLPEVAFDRSHFNRVKSFIGAIRRAQKLKIPAVWTIHNLYEHESKFRTLDRLVSNMVIRYAREFHVHSIGARNQVLEEYSNIPADKVRIIEHPNYIGCYPEGITQQQARSRLGIPSNHICYLFFGNVRKYKGVGELVKVFKEANLPDATLIIAGRPRTHQDFEFIEETRTSSPNIRVFPMFIPDEDLQVYFAAADVAVLPYREILTSGAALLAMSFAKPCIAPDVSTFNQIFPPDSSLLYAKDNPNGLIENLRKAIDTRDRLPEMGLLQKKKAEQYSWETFTDEIAGMYHDATSSERASAIIRT